jgi:hypothetical protein
MTLRALSISPYRVKRVTRTNHAGGGGVGGNLRLLTNHGCGRGSLQWFGWFRGVQRLFHGGSMVDLWWIYGGSVRQFGWIRENKRS